MQLNNLGVIERKMLGALLILSDRDNMVSANLNQLAEQMNYKASGGALTFALKVLERDNYVIRTSKDSYVLLI